MAQLLTDPLAEEIIKRYARASGERTNWESHWEEIAERVLPNYATSFVNKSDTIAQGTKKTEQMVDATAASALIRFAAAMESMLTPRNTIWHRLVPSDKKLMQHRSVRLWFESLNETVFKYRYAPKANFASQQHETYMSLGAFGTGVLFIDKLEDPVARGLRYRALHLGGVYFLENHQGIIDTALRRFDYTARQAVQKFGRAKLDEKVLQAADDPLKRETKFWFIHCVQPREDYDPRRLDLRGMTYSSHYVSETGRNIVEDGGYNTFPYAISRYVMAPGELYGRSPAMMALPAIKVLNEEKKTVLKQGHRTVDPVLLVADDGILDQFSLRPGAMNSGGVTAEGRPLVHTLPVGNIAIGKELMDDERMVINDMFLVTLFQILVETPSMTATEVIERAREKGALLSPTMGRQQSESLGPMVERDVDVLSQLNLIEPMPQILREAQGEYDIQYDSPLSRAQKAESAAGTMRTIQYASDIYNITQDPQVLDPFNWDVIIPELADINAMPVRYLLGSEQIAAKRAQRAEAQQTQQMVEAAPSIASFAKTTGAVGSPRA